MYKRNWFNIFINQLKEYGKFDVWITDDNKICCNNEDIFHSIKETIETLYKSQGDEVELGVECDGNVWTIELD